jgi:hypothetical protein
VKRLRGTRGPQGARHQPLWRLHQNTGWSHW